MEMTTSSATAPGIYIPPHKRSQNALERLNSKEDEESLTLQKEKWEYLKKKLNGLINKINNDNVADTLPEFFQMNLIRIRGLFASVVLKSQLAASVRYTRVFACLVAVINTKLPENGRIILFRLIKQLRRGLKLNDKILATSALDFIAELLNQRVVNEVLALEIVQDLLEKPNDQLISFAIKFTKNVGALLEETVPKGLHIIFEGFRKLLQGSNSLSRSIQFEIEDLFRTRKLGFKEFPILQDDLDMVETDDQITHEMSFNVPDESLKVECHEELNYFTFDPDFEKNESLWKEVSEEILGVEEVEEGYESGSASIVEPCNDDEAESPIITEPVVSEAVPEAKQEDVNLNEVDVQLLSNINNSGNNDPNTSIIKDMTETELISLRRVIYLTIMSSISFEEACHKLLKMTASLVRNVEASKKDIIEKVVVNMLVDCCSQGKMFEKFFGSLAIRLCQLSKSYNKFFVEVFKERYDTCHRLETNPLRNIAKLYAFIMVANALRWEDLLQFIILTEEETTSSSRIFVKIIFEDLAENVGVESLKDRLLNPKADIYAKHLEDWNAMKRSVVGLFPKDSLENVRFSINFFTMIGLGPLTDDMRDFLKNPPPELLNKQEMNNEYESETDSNSGRSNTESSSEGYSTDSGSSSRSPLSKIRSRRSRSNSSKSVGRSPNGRLKASSNERSKSYERARGPQQVDPRAPPLSAHPLHMKLRKEKLELALKHLNPALRTKLNEIESRLPFIDPTSTIIDKSKVAGETVKDKEQRLSHSLRRNRQSGRSSLTRSTTAKRLSRGKRSYSSAESSQNADIKRRSSRRRFRSISRSE